MFDQLARPDDAVREFATNHGERHPEQAWLLHDWDVWVKNPHYTGPDVPHPEESGPEDYDLELSLRHDLPFPYPADVPACGDADCPACPRPSEDDIPF